MSVTLMMLLTGALQLNFHNVSFGDFIEHRFGAYASFSDTQQREMCELGDTMSCVLVFLEVSNADDAKTEELVSFIDGHFTGPHASLARYILIARQFEEISTAEMRTLLASLPERWSRKLNPLLLKKMYDDGDYNAFMDNFTGYDDPDLIRRYVRVLLRRDVRRAYRYIMDLPEHYHERFFISLHELVGDHRAQFVKAGLAREFDVWKLRVNFQRIRYRQTVRLADRWFPKSQVTSSTAAWTAHLYKARALTRRREHDKAVRVYNALAGCYADVSPSETDMFRFFRGMGYSLAALGRNEAAVRVYLDGYEHFSEDADRAAEFLYHAADIARLDRDFPSAEKYYGMVLDTYEASSKYEISQFLFFWILYLQNRYEEAAAVLADIRERFNPGEYSHRRALYWTARVNAKLGDEDAALDIYARLAKRFPATFYGALAASRIARRNISRKPDKLERRTDVTFSSSRFMPEMLWLLALDIRKNGDFLRELLYIVKPQIRRTGSEMDLLAASYLARRSRQYHLAVSFMKSVSSLSGAGRKYIRLSYPVGFEREILPHADYYGVPPLFVFSIARQESLFDFKAVSRSYAIGFLQILPSTARLLARRETYGRITPGILKKPLTNIRFGTKYLKILLRWFNGRLSLAAGAYNAGPGRIRRWVREKKNMELDEFIEDIPIFQTRDYVKKVMRNYAVYHYIYHGRPYDGMSFDLDPLREK